MIRKTTPKLIHWNYFLGLEQDLISISRYVEFDEDNFSTFSTELLKLLFSASSEIDVVAKLLCHQINKESKASNIGHYRATIMKAYPEFSSIDVHLTRYGLTLTPWDNWANKRKPKWWDAYNSVKHERNKYYSAANLKHSINALGGLYIILLYFYMNPAREGELYPSPELLSIGEPIITDQLFYQPRTTAYIFPYW